jgi:putative ABC transport system permease protein
MLKNYFVIAFRSILRNKLFSSLNILGLAFGMCSALLIFLWVTDEFMYDKFHTHGNRLYRVMENQEYSDGKRYTFAATPGPMAPFIKDKYAEIERASRLTWQVSNLFSYEDKSFNGQGYYADQDFMEMFTFEVLHGDRKTALKEKNSIVIGRKMAEKYFGTTDAVGKLLTMNNKEAFTVTAVLGDIPRNSSLQFEYLLPFEHFWDENKSWLGQWNNNNIRTYLLLREDADTDAFTKKIENEIKPHNERTNVKLFIQPFTEMYLYNNFEDGVQAGGRIDYLRIFFAVAFFVLVIACINFMSLSTAQATKRAKEVGLRKVIGAVPHQLFRQFMSESFITVFIAAIIAGMAAFLLIPIFNEVTGKTLGLNLLDARVVTVFVAIIIFTAFVAGSYPSFFISSFKPVQVLKGQLRSGSRAALFRQVLVVVQFSLSIFLIISTAVVFRQMSFMQNRDIGFDRNNLFYVWMQGDMAKNFETFRTRLEDAAGIESATCANQLPIDIGNSTSNISWEGKDPSQQMLFTTLNTDFNFIQSMKMQMLEGRTFDKDLITDTSGYIVNERAAEKFGFKGSAAGQDLTLWGKKGKILGVVKDFNFGSLHNAVDPLVMYVTPGESGCVLVRAKAGETENAVRSVETLFKEYAPGRTFEYSFLSQDWENFYQAEAQRGKIFNTLAVLSIFISCLGLFGLSAFSAERRTKELGIRKVLGASVPGLVRLMNQEFTILVIIAACIGCPVGWYLMTSWLESYAYHVEVGVLTLAAASGACLLIAIGTVSYHSIRVAATDPVKSLRYE